MEELMLEENKKEHEEHLRMILKLLKKEELYTKFSKCKFWIPKIPGARLLLGKVEEGHGSGVEVVEWRKKRGKWCIKLCLQPWRIAYHEETIVSTH
nr:putative reverse transcriptase domain-containing protein [Tanacetum cinerariifolium]